MKIVAILRFALILCMTSSSIFLITLTFSVQTYSRDALIIYATACSIWQLCKNAVIILTTKSFITIWIWKAFYTWIIWIVGVIWTKTSIAHKIVLFAWWESFGFFHFTLKCVDVAIFHSFDAVRGSFTPICCWRCWCVWNTFIADILNRLILSTLIW